MPKSPSPPRHHPRNLLNDLTGRDWLKFTKSWFICDSRRYHKNKSTELHPARFPEEMVAEFLQFFTKRGGWVLDPFCGSGATLIAALEQGRNAVGIELSEKYVEITSRRLPPDSPAYVLQTDAREVDNPALWSALPVRVGRASSPPAEEGDTTPGAPDPTLEMAGWKPAPRGGDLPQFDFLLTSPPYFDMLHHPRGGVKSKHQERIEAGLDQVYSPHPQDLGNLADYDQFIESLGDIFDRCRAVVKRGKYMVVVIQNLRAPGGEILPLAWDLTRRVSRTWLFQGERIWCQNSKRLGIWGYPSIFVPNYHHHYCLIFRNTRDTY
jgi:16S rRNA G966 N2-methylase RsmD